MEWVRSVLRFLWPELLLEGVAWEHEWKETQRERFRKISIAFFVLAALGYIAHHYLLDIPNNLQPIENWFWFRVGIAVLCACCAIFYVSKFSDTKWFRVPAIIGLAIGCYAQAQVSLAAPDLAPWFYAFAFAIGAVLVLQMSVLKSLLFVVPVMFSFYPALLESGVALDTLLSATFFMSLVAAIARSSYAFELRAFALTQERDQQREEFIEMQRDFSTRLRSFIPRVIADRMQRKIDINKMSVIEASVDVLTAKQKNVACLFSDIRGFTQGSRDLDSFLAESVIPEVKACSDAVENFSGIPRKIGDLIFAYFDDEDVRINIARAVLAGIALSRINEDMNATVSSVNVRRYILISTGEAIVGNVGGINSGVEITALGPPVNFLSRLDDGTKYPGLASELSQGDLILCERSATLLKQMTSELAIKRVCLREIDLTIRDFPEVDVVYILKPSDHNHTLLSQALEEVGSSR